MGSRIDNFRDMKLSIMQENGRSEARESGNRVANNAIMMNVSANKYGEDNSTLDREEGSMVSNLPLLFANGYPTSLEKITMVYVYYL